MSDNFSWQTDEETGWDDPAVRPRTSLPPNGRRTWLWVLIPAVVAAVLIITLRLQRQAAAVSAAAELDIMAAHQVSQNAAANQDLDLFRLNLSRRDPDWADTQRDLVETGLFLDRLPFGLQWIDHLQETLPYTITLSPDFQAAELLYEQEYQLVWDETENKVIRLQQMAVYRRGDGRWLRADPLSPFWGATRQERYTHLTLIFPERDAPLVERLGPDLNEQIVQMCRTFPDLACPADYRLTLQFTIDPQHFFIFDDLEEILNSEQRLRLPSPTLVGWPVDETGYTLIRNGYAGPLVAAAIADLIGYECCLHGLMFRAFLDKELSLLGLRPWPLTPAVYETLSLGQMPTATRTVWGRPNIEYGLETTRLALYSLVDFLTEQYRPEISPVQWQKALGANLSYQNWLAEVAGFMELPNAFNTAWLIYTQEQLPPIPQPPVPLPSGEVVLYCTYEQSTPALYRYRFQPQLWDVTWVRTEVYQVGPDGYVAEEIIQNGRRLVYVQDGQYHVIASTTENSVYFTQGNEMVFILGGRQPDHYFAYMSGDYRTSSGDGRGSGVENWLVDLEQCGRGACQPRAIPGYPIWSPDEQHILYYSGGFFSENSTLFLSDGHEQNVVELGIGSQPFWLDNQHYGFIKIEGENNAMPMTNFFIGQIGDPTPRLAFSSTQFAQLASPGSSDPFSLIIFLGTARPNGQQELMLLGAIEEIRDEGVSAARYVVAYLQWDETWQTLRHSELVWDSLDLGLPSFSLDGQYQVITGLDSQTGATRLHLRHLGTGEEQQYELGSQFTSLSFLPKWSQDDRWLITNGDNELALIAPKDNYIHRIPHAFSQCNRIFYVPGE